eukprot:gb/GFBE01057390.1/.p1 GENE.gb/GFBE01057390.1/~~gb/GFBE01057390.1/.p1  ORF type:complete len:506 (+),score=102.19 gb/GFBE01057390.1/:1-1518(+)
MTRLELSSDLSLEAAIRVLRDRQSSSKVGSEALRRLNSIGSTAPGSPELSRQHSPGGADSHPASLPSRAGMPGSPAQANEATRPSLEKRPGSAGSALKFPTTPGSPVDEPVNPRLVALLRSAPTSSQPSPPESRTVHRRKLVKLPRPASSPAGFRRLVSTDGQPLSRQLSLGRQSQPRRPTSSKFTLGARSVTFDDGGAYERSSANTQGLEDLILPPKEKPQQRHDSAKHVDSLSYEGVKGWNDEPQDVSREAACVFWNQPIHYDEVPRQDTETGSLQEAKVSPQALIQGRLRKLAGELGFRFNDLKEAVSVFQKHCKAADEGLFDVRLSMQNFQEVLLDMCKVTSLQQLPDAFVKAAFKAADRDQGGDIDIKEFAIWFSAFSFSEEVTLTPDERRNRDLARALGVEVKKLDEYKKLYDKYDTDGSGVIEFHEFSGLVRDLLKIPADTDLPKERLKSMWQNADTIGNGEVDFEEFCVFYFKICETEDGADPCVDFYRNVRRVPVT